MKNPLQTNPLFISIRQLIEESKQQVAITVNAEITLLYWKVGRRINEEVLGNERAEYGKQVVATIAQQLSTTYGKGWGEKQLRQCMQFALVFPDEQIVYALRRQLSWTHLRNIIYMDDPLKRSFYVECVSWKSGHPVSYRSASNPCYTNEPPSAKNRIRLLPMIWNY